MPLLINGESDSQPGHSNSGRIQKGSLGRITSDMKISSSQRDSAGLNRFMRDMSSLFNQDQVKPFLSQ
jgi:hypothetical protein